MSLIIEKPRQYRRRALLITLVAMIIVYILWNVPDLRVVLYPLNLFVTYIHEAGHSLAALLTGGQVVGFVVSADGSGLARTIGGNSAVILPAGYLGAALFGSLLFYLINRFARYARYIAFGLGLFILIFTILFARPDETGAPVAIFVGAIFGALLAFSGLRGPNLLNMLVLNVLAITTALEAFFDLWFLTRVAGTASRGAVFNDAAQFAQQYAPLLGPSIIAFTWAGIALVMFSIALWYGAIRPFREEINDAYNTLRR